MFFIIINLKTISFLLLNNFTIKYYTNLKNILLKNFKLKELNEKNYI